MNIENSIKDVIAKKLDEGIIEKLVAENLEKCINTSLENLMGRYGDLTKVIEKKLKDVMANQLSSYDYSKYIVKLDCVLTEILKHTTFDNKQILENFQELMVNHDIPKKIKTSEIFNKYKEFIDKTIDASDLDEDYYYDGVQYVDVRFEVEYQEERSWSDFKTAKLIFECEENEKLNVEVELSKFMNYPWSIRTNIDTSINSLRYLNEFKIYLLKLSQNQTEIEIDDESDSYEVSVEQQY